MANVTAVANSSSVSGNISSTIQNVSSTIFDMMSANGSTTFSEMSTTNDLGNLTTTKAAVYTTTNINITENVSSSMTSSTTTGTITATSTALTTVSEVVTTAVTTITSALSSVTSKVVTNAGSSGGDTTTVDTMKDFYRDPLIAMAVIACLLFLILVAVFVCWCKRRGKTVYKTVELTPKKSVTEPVAKDVEGQGRNRPNSKPVKPTNGTSTEEVGLEMEGVDNPTYHSPE